MIAQLVALRLVESLQLELYWLSLLLVVSVREHVRSINHFEFSLPMDTLVIADKNLPSSLFTANEYKGWRVRLKYKANKRIPFNERITRNDHLIEWSAWLVITTGKYVPQPQLLPHRQWKVSDKQIGFTDHSLMRTFPRFIKA